MRDYRIDSLGGDLLPDALAFASEADVEDALRRAAAHLGRNAVEVRRVTTTIGCIVSTDVIAYVDGVALLVARPELY